MTCKRQLLAVWYRPRSMLPRRIVQYTLCLLLLLLLLLLCVACLKDRTETALELVRSQTVLFAGEVELRDSKLTQTANVRPSSEMKTEVVSLHRPSHMTNIPIRTWKKRTDNLSALLTTAVEDDMVLDTVNIRISPKQLTVSEGHSSQLVCMSMQLLNGNGGSAPYMTFELPPMSLKDEQNVKLELRPGAAILKIRHVRRGHQGVYTCTMADKRRFNSVVLLVIQRDLSEDAKEEGDSKDAVISVEGLDFPAAGHGVAEENLRDLRRHLNQDFRSDVDTEQLLARGRFQEKQVEKFCAKYNLSHQANSLPLKSERSNLLYRHLLINDKAQTIFCFVPKTGCTNLKLLFFLVLGYIPLSEFVQARDAVDQNRLESIQFLESFFNRNEHQRRFSLTNYFKFVMCRNPLDRLISAFRSKVARYSLSGLKNDTPHYNWLRKAILMQTHPQQYSEFLHQHGLQPVNISFKDFVDYWVDLPKEIKFDEHFCSVFSLSQPCRIRYHFYGNFKHFEVDSSVLRDKIQAKPQFLRKGYYANNMAVSTEALAPKLFAELDTWQKQKLLQVLAQDLDFYYHIFPEEKDIHKSLLSTNLDLPMSSIAGP